MLSWHQLLGESELEIRLLRKGHETRVAAELHCADCGRVPLTGEQVFEFDDGTVCTLCRGNHDDALLAISPVHHVEHGISVRRMTLPRAA